MEKIFEKRRSGRHGLKDHAGQKTPGSYAWTCEDCYPFVVLMNDNVHILMKRQSLWYQFHTTLQGQNAHADDTVYIQIRLL